MTTTTNDAPVFNTEPLTIGKGWYAETFAPGTIELYGNLKIRRYDSTRNEGRPILQVWYGKQSKAFYHYSFPGKTVERQRELREEKIVELKKNDDANSAQKAKRKADRDNAPNTWKVGDLLANSWGYDQTNVDFWQVVRVGKKCVWIRRINGRTVEATGGMSSNVTPVKDAFSERYPDEVRKIVQSKDYLSADHGVLRRTTENSTHYCSWYH